MLGGEAHSGSGVKDFRFREEVRANGVYYIFGLPYVRRFDIVRSITLLLARDAHQEACLGVVHGIGTKVFTDEQVSFVQRLSRHILRAIGLNQRFPALQAERQAFEAALDGMDAAA